MAGPLQDLMVVDVSRVRPGLIAGVLLADHGAQVIKIEPPGGHYYACEPSRKGWDRGKLSIELDIDDAAGRRDLAALLRSADVLIHSFDDAQARRRGLDHASLAGECPALVVCALTAYGADTPLADRPYGESLAAARLGAMLEKRSPFREGPLYLGHPALHYGQAFLAAINILAALRARRHNGVGQEVEASLLDSFLAQSPMNWWSHPQKLSYINRELQDPSRGVNFGHTRLVTGLVQCGDGEYMQIHTGGPGAFKRTMDLLGFGDRIRDVDGPEMLVPLSEDEYRIARVELYEAMKRKPREEWLRLFQEADIACLPVLRPAEALLDNQVEHMQQRIEVADADYGTLHQAAPAVRYSNIAAVVPAPAPAVGRDNVRLAGLAARPQPGFAKRGEDVGSALEGLKVLDFSSFFACGYAARMLSDLGADVIKVETASGDQMRPLPDPFEACQRGKRDVVIDLKTPEGLALVQRLVAEADVVMHNWRPGKADKAGIGYEQLRAINPALVYAYLPGYGSSGPKAKLKSFAPLISGFCGLLYEGGGEGNPPVPSVFGNEDYNNGFLGAFGVLAALEHRERSGTGTYLECPQVSSSLFTTSEHFLDAEREVVWSMRMDKAQMGFSALDRLYRTEDGWICICCESDDGFAALAKAIGRPELAADGEYRDHASRLAHREALGEIIAAWFAGRKTGEAFDHLDAGGVACEIAREEQWLPEFFAQDWAVASQRVFDQADSLHGPIREIGLFNRLHGTPGVRKGTAPKLGEHTREVLLELGCSEAEIDALAQARKVKLA
ncbi:CaiB/BaiF CoA-transferase family protein [Luteimonas saliphila]|uniref:CaiB/BaiF CoA-transferase family protein n=1 Tax=Luteimonas saliphila TaxID=2804919 RepID=UPI00192DA1E9|nr:CoA transferase [Luteimonas saliphila]